MAERRPAANNGQWKCDLKSGSAICRPAMQKEATMARAARTKSSQPARVGLMGFSQEER